MEIVYLVRGELVFHVAGRDYAMKGGDLFWTHADEEHSSSQKTYGKSLIYWTQVRLPEKPAAFLTLDAAHAWPLVEGLRALPLRVFKGTRRLKPVFEEALVLAEGPASPLGRLALAGRLVEFLRTVAECARQRASPQVSDDIQNALRLLESRGDEPTSIEELARAAFLSESRFKAKFREQLGMPPWEYMLRRRVERAKRLLAEERLSVTEVAHRLGFSSSQYFATVFRRFTLQRPSEVRPATRKR
jgi:AraC-like DNA-binding protein